MRYLSAGESHGKGLVFIIEGFPSNVPININEINQELSERQKGYGRGKRMGIESDSVEIISGIRGGKTLGSPIAMLIKNNDWKNWEHGMSPENPNQDPSLEISQPRPGHADLAGAIKYNHKDIRNILERASARETAMRTATGAVAKQLLRQFNIQIRHRVVSIGDIEDKPALNRNINYWDTIQNSELSMYDRQAETKAKALIDRSKAEGDTLGGIIEVSIENVPIGLGSHVHYDRKLNAKLAMEIVGLQSVKGFEIGLGFDSSKAPGSKVHDEIYYDGQYRHKSNNAGGIEGGMSNGETIWFRAAVKPIPTLMRPLKSVDMKTKEVVDAIKERSDVCAVPAAGVVMDNIAAWVIAQEMIIKFGGDSLEEMIKNYKTYCNYVKER